MKTVLVELYKPDKLVESVELVESVGISLTPEFKNFITKLYNNNKNWIQDKQDNLDNFLKLQNIKRIKRIIAIQFSDKFKLNPKFKFENINLEDNGIKCSGTLYIERASIGKTKVDWLRRTIEIGRDTSTHVLNSLIYEELNMHGKKLNTKRITTIEDISNDFENYKAYNLDKDDIVNNIILKTHTDLGDDCNMMTIRYINKNGQLVFKDTYTNKERESETLTTYFNESPVDARGKKTKRKKKKRKRTKRRKIYKKKI
jgi:hypothetical protein